MSIDICNGRTFEFWDIQNQLLKDKHNGIEPDNELVDYLFSNLVSILRERKQEIIYGEPQYKDPDKGFSITMFRVGIEAYGFAELCCIALGKEPELECGVTMAVNFDSAAEKDDFFDRFQAIMRNAEEKLVMT
jgi:hypothetical protein